MKKIILLLIIVFFTILSCTSVDDTEIPYIRKVFINEDFDKLDKNPNLEVDGWQNINEIGTKKWFADDYEDDFYAKFSSFQSGDLVNVAWLITPEFDTKDTPNIFLQFESAQNFVTNNDNNLKVYVSKDYDGTNLSTATWTELPANVANSTTGGYVFVKSGKINLSAYTGGKLRVAFKVTGSGTNTALDGLFQLDDILIMSYY